MDMLLSAFFPMEQMFDVLAMKDFMNLEQMKTLPLL